MPSCEFDHDTDERTTPELFAQTEWGELWAEADLLSAVLYARSSKKLNLPPEWKAVIPTGFKHGQYVNA
jgi:hypothetical protein